MVLTPLLFCVFVLLSSAQLPYTPYHKYFEPDFELHIKPSHVTENLNTAAHIDEVIEKLFRQLNEIEAVRCSLLLFSFCCVFLLIFSFSFPFSRSQVPGAQIESGNEAKTPALFERGGGAADERADEGRERGARGGDDETEGERAARKAREVAGDARGAGGAAMAATASAPPL